MSTNSSITALDWLKRSTAALKLAGDETPRLDSLIMLEDSLGLDRAKLLAFPELKLEANKLSKLNDNLSRRLDNEPLAYIRQKISFYGRMFFVDHRVLVPRPESETMIDELKKLNLPEGSLLADIGTGSGALGVTAALEVTNVSVDLYDISLPAIVVATKNANAYQLKFRVEKSDLLKNLIRTPTVILANLPYVPINSRLTRAVKHEPDIALFGGPNGMDLYKRFWEQLQAINKIEFVLTEALPVQHEIQRQYAESAGYRQEKINDFIQVFRKN